MGRPIGNRDLPTYDTATPEQVAEVREEVRAKMAEADRTRAERHAKARAMLGLPANAP
jgi:hypothetical protein